MDETSYFFITRCVRPTNSPPSVNRLSAENVGISRSHNPMGLHGLLEGELYLTYSLLLYQREKPMDWYISFKYRW
jgi:hypothetical protein